MHKQLYIKYYLKEKIEDIFGKKTYAESQRDKYKKVVRNLEKELKNTDNLSDVMAQLATDYNIMEMNSDSAQGKLSDTFVSVGRFVSEDKVRGFVILPYTLNHYGYCWNNPVDFVDRDGNLPTVVIGAVIGLAAGALGEVVSQTIDGVQSGKSVLDSLLDVNPGKVVLEAGKGAVTGAVAGTGAGLLVVAGTSGVVEFGGDLLDQKVLQKKEDLDYTHAISNGLWSATTTLVVGGITNEISNVIHPEAKTGTMDYLFGRDKAKAVVKAQYNNARSSSSRAKYWNRLEKIKLQKTLGTIKYGIIETGKTIIDEIKNEIYRDEVNEDIVEEIDKKISCSVY